MDEHVTGLAINRMLGLRLAPAGEDYILEMPELPLHLNHIGTIHASAQFALAEAASGEFLLRHLGGARSRIFAVLRTAKAKFRKPAQGRLRAAARFAKGTADSVSADLESRGRMVAWVQVEVSDTAGVATMSGQYDWFLQRRAAAR